MDTKVIHPELSYLLYGLFFKIHNDFGRYKNERQYADALENLLKANKIKYQREKALPSSFDGEHGRRNIPDFIIENKVVLEIKAKRFLSRDDYYQVKRYLSALNKKLGILVNFHSRYIEPKRVLNSSVQE